MLPNPSTTSRRSEAENGRDRIGIARKPEKTKKQEEEEKGKQEIETVFDREKKEEHKGKKREGTN